MDNLMNVVKSNFAPVVLVLCTPDAENVFKKDDTTLVKLLNRFGFSPQLVKLKTINDQSYDIRGFQVRFTSLSDLESRTASPQQQEELANAYLSQVATHHATENIYQNFKFSDKESIPAYQKALQKDSTPWYTYYRWEYLRSMGISELECFEHPVACLLVVSSENEKIPESFVSLMDDRAPPSVFRGGVMDPNIPKYYLLLHDMQAPSPVDLSAAEKKLAQMRTTFEKSKCFLVKANSQKEKNANGNFLSPEDLNGIELFTRELVFKSLVPNMERTVRSLNETVDSSRKGLSNKLNRWIFGKNKQQQPVKEKQVIESSDPTSANITYPIGSVENSQKKLADYLFMLQDYQEALNVYKNASKDYMNDKSWKYYAAACEMSGLCIFLMDPLKKDLESHLDNAFLFYVRDNMSRHVIRATIFFADILRMRKNFSEAAQKFIRAAEREAEHDRLCAAMLQEQAAFCMLFSNPPQFRKYAFRLILAGHLYNLNNQIKHSYRCYTAAFYLYQSKNWFLVDDHIHSTLARQSFSMNRMDDAIFYIQHLISKNAQMPNRQSSYFREFLHIFMQNSQTKGETRPLLPLPVVLNDTIVVFLRDYPPKSPLQETWKNMERTLKDEGKIMSPHQRAKMRMKKERKNKPRLSVVGEPIYVEVEIRNPLQIPLQFTEVQLIGTHTPNQPPQKNDAEETPAENNDAEEIPAENNDAASAFSVVPFDLLLAPNETKKLRLSVEPQREGTLVIDGLGFLLCGLGGSAKFELPRRRLNDTQKHKKGVFYENPHDLTVKITRPMPLLDVEIQKFPTHLLHGQLEQVNLVLKNSGSSALKDIKVKMSEPAFFSFAAGDNTKAAELALLSQDLSIVHIPIASLAPNSSVTVPMWIRGAQVGQFSFHFLFWYRSEVPDTEMKHRLQRLTKQSRVLPSLKVSTTTNLSYSSINAYLLNLEVSNPQGSSEFRIQHISSVSTSWTIQPLSQKGSITNEESICNIGPEQTTNMFFRINPVSDSEKKNEKTGLFHTNYAVVASPSEEVLNLQNSLFPTYGFLLREKSAMNTPAPDSTPSVTYSSNITTPFLASSANSAQNAAIKETAKKAEETTLDMIIVWETTLESGEKITLRGQHNVCNISFLTQTTVDKAINENTTLRFSIESPRKIVHDFSKDSMCLVPILFHVNNVSQTAPISFYLETLQPQDQIEINPSFGTQKRSQYFWAECSTHVSDLKPEGKIALESCVCFTRPGVYNLNRYKFSLKDEKSSIRQQIYSPFQHIIMVEDKNEIS
eukprot:TRINITY_DN2322_c0_g2_i1.p1 TRINITY_DN2322_c0_g2~~TRINITY_DN2322_c0_g2_i1.p1  ORF type:complete len:1266 (+),score=437.02 TRINITY_DN2322_c0_g2_i1:149-3946(+)